MLYAKQVKIDNANKDGYIMSADYVPGVSGFIIRWNGDCEFNIGTFRGDIYARNGFFSGDISSGQLFSSNRETGQNLPPVTFANNQTAKDVYDHFGGYDHTVPVTSGSWAGQGGLVGLSLSTDTIPTSGPGLGGLTTRYILRIQLIDQPEVVRYWASTVQNTLGASLIIDGGRRGPTLRLTGVPLGDNGLSSGEIYRDSGGVLRIKV